MDVLVARYTYPKPPKCIFCGGVTAPMTDEHIIPRGIGGALVYKNATCIRCKENIDPVEGTCMNQLFGTFRLRVGFRSRTGRLLRGKVLIDTIEEDGKQKPKSIPIEECPRHLLLPRFFRPQMFWGPWPSGEDAIMWGWANKADIEQAVRLHGSALAPPIQFNPIMFCRMLGKIAHSHTILITHVRPYFALTV